MIVTILWQTPVEFGEEHNIVEIYTPEAYKRDYESKFIPKGREHIKNLIDYLRIDLNSFENDRQQAIEEERRLLKCLCRFSSENKYTGEFKELDRQRKRELSLINFCNQRIKQIQREIKENLNLTDDQKVARYFDFMHYVVEDYEVIE